MKKEIRWRLENLRDQAGYSQKDVSQILRFSDNTYGQYERGEHSPSVETFISLAQLYNTSLDYILRGKKDGDACEKTVNVFKQHGIKDPFILRTEDWSALTYDELMSLTKHFESLVEQVKKE
ncbi:helix-turn-helix domain-containing protein [Virgibacillus alimentarius]|uniref:Transcriptional regulator with XRE-family HTH domain n=1 Tax=Virgibacillus alimentarius TaxID=698769 RepID=A0ABS4SBP2_9BACI|nr:helix-turn-helix transcriptional regulator [Virgibacillus alimentarius]MBP2258782.1 transcriptional regulator with XRE-family HTH domain [Virgibacillus alimentarius]